MTKQQNRRIAPTVQLDPKPTPSSPSSPELQRSTKIRNELEAHWGNEELLALLEEAREEQEEFMLGTQASDWRERWHNPLWKFARHLKGHALFEGLEASEAFEVCSEGLQILYERENNMPSADVDEVWGFACDSEEDAEEAFINAWSRIRRPKNFDPLVTAVAEAQPMSIAGESRHFSQVLGVVGRLACLVEDGDKFFVSQERLARLLGFERTSVGQMLIRMQRAGYLTLLKRGSATGGHASTYQLNRSVIEARNTQKVVSIDRKSA